nr:hypothetical protein [uncultured Thermosynechococcus sp.]
MCRLRRYAAGRHRENTAGGHRRYDLAKLKPKLFRAQADAHRRTLAYARVSSYAQKEDIQGEFPKEPETTRWRQKGC